MMDKKLTFEESMLELGEILSSMESGKLTLDESIEAYEKAVKMIGECRASLEGSRRRIEILKQGSGEAVEIDDEFAN